MLLKVKCDKCNTKYKLDDSRIQGKGAKITCPRCRNVFVVMKPVTGLGAAVDSDDPAETATVSMQHAARELLRGGLGSKPLESGGVSGSRFPAARAAGAGSAEPGGPLAGRGPKPDASRRKSPDKSVSALLKTTGPLAKFVKRPSNANELDWKEVGITTFKVKVGIGLVYDFSDVATLKKYIAENRVVETDRVSFDGKVWTVLKDINSVDEFFIDQWVALKLERMLEEEREAEEAGLPSPLAGLTAQPTGPPGDGTPILGTQPALGDTRPSTIRLVPEPSGASGGPRDGSGDSMRLDGGVAVRPPESSSPPPPPPARASTAGDVAGGEVPNGLSAKDLFADVQVPEEPSLANVPVDVPANRPAPAPSRTPVARAKSMRAVAGRSSMVLARLFDALVVLLLALVAGYLGWKYYAESQRLGSARVEQVDPREGMDELERLIAERFPVAYAASTGEVQGPALGVQPGEETPTPVPVRATPRPHRPPRAIEKKPSVHRGAKTRQSNEGKPVGDRKSNVVVSNITAEDLYQVAIQALDMNNHQMAIESMKNAVRMKPQSAKYRYMLGYAYYRGRRYEEAIAAFQETLALKKAPNTTHKWLGEIYAAQGKKEAAISAFERYLKGSPNDADAIKKKIATLSNS